MSVPVRVPHSPRGYDPTAWNGYVVRVGDEYVNDWGLGLFEHARQFQHYQDALPVAEHYRRRTTYGVVWSYNRAAREEAERGLVGEREGRGA